MENYVHELRYSQETYQIIGAAMKVHSLLGPVFTEKVYQDALALEFMERGIPFKREVELHASYKGVTLDSTYKPDFICYDKMIVELKAVKEIDDVHRSQAINYAKVAGFKLSLLFNFEQTSLEKERFPIG
ncbi:MAG: GxxExxY protein [Prevotella sp.]|nr:GxxExxY protein [Prevotella sp.]